MERESAVELPRRAAGTALNRLGTIGRLGPLLRRFRRRSPPSVRHPIDWRTGSIDWRPKSSHLRGDGLHSLHWQIAVKCMKNRKNQSRTERFRRSQFHEVLPNGKKQYLRATYVVLPNGEKRYLRATTGDIALSILLPFWGLVVGGIAASRCEKARGLTMMSIGAAGLVGLMIFQAVL